MAESEVKSILRIFETVLEAIASGLQDVDTTILRDYDVNKILKQFCKPILNYAGIELLEVEVSKEAIIKDYSKTARNREVVPVVHVREIMRNTRLIVETTTSSRKLEHHIVMVLFVNSDRSVKCEVDPWIDISRHPPWSDKTKQVLKEVEERLKPFLPYAIGRLVELILRKIGGSGS